MSTPSTLSQRSQSTSGQFVAVSASATDFANGLSRGLYVGTSGDVTIKDYTGTTVTFYGLAAGVIHPIQAKALLTLANGAANAIAVY